MILSKPAKASSLDISFSEDFGSVDVDVANIQPGGGNGHRVQRDGLRDRSRGKLVGQHYDALPINPCWF